MNWKKDFKNNFDDFFSYNAHFKCDKTCAWLVTLATLVKFLYCANKAVTRQERKQLEYNAVFACKSDTHIYRRSFLNPLREYLKTWKQ